MSVRENDELEEENHCPTVVIFGCAHPRWLPGSFQGTFPPLSEKCRLDCHGSAAEDHKMIFFFFFLAARILLSLRFPCAAPAHFHVSSDALTVA